MAQPTEVSKDAYLVEMIDVTIDKLFVDHTYQRPQSPTQIKRLVTGWLWKRYVPILVTARADNRFAIIDGQQRYAAALELGFKQLPAILVVSESLELEAELFVGANSTKPVSSADRFRARIVIGESKAKSIEHVVNQLGFHLGYDRSKARTPFTIDAINQVEYLYDHNQLYKVLSTIMKIWGADPHKEMLRQDALTGMSLALQHLERHGHKVDAFITKIAQVEFNELDSLILAKKKAAFTKTRNSGAAYATALIEVYNYRRQNQIPPYGTRIRLNNGG